MKRFATLLLPALLWAENADAPKQIPAQLYVEWGMLQANIQRAQRDMQEKLEAACGGSVIMDAKNLPQCAPKPEAKQP